MKERVAADVAPRVYLIHELLERQILVLERLEGDVADLRQEGSEGRVTRQIETQHETVDEEPDELLEFRSVPVGDRRADDDVVLPTVALKQDRHRGERRGVQRRAVAPP